MKNYLVKIIILLIFILCVGCNESDKNDQVEEKVEYTVKFVVDGVENNEVVKAGEKVKRPNNPFKEGYEFIGWYIGSELYDFEEGVTNNLEIEAKFEEYIPELIYNNRLNLFIKTYSNYSYDDLNDEIVKKDTIYILLYANATDKVNSVTSNVSATLESGEKIKFDSKINNADKITTHSSLVCSQKIHNDNFKNFILDVFYKYKENDEEKSTTILYKENVIKLTIIDKGSKPVNDFNKETCEIDGEKVKLFKSFSVNCEKYNDSESFRINLKFAVSNNLKGKYHLDMQMYGVKDNEEYPLIGYYNLSNDIIYSYQQSSTVSNKLNFDYIYVKCKFIDYNGETHYLLYKEECK